MSLRVATAGLELMEDALRAQGLDPIAIDWKPPASGRADDLALLGAAYGDQRIERANAAALSTLADARPVLVGAGPAADRIPGVAGERLILHAGPKVDAADMCAPQRIAAAAACVFEGWAPDTAAAVELLTRGDVALAPTHSLGAAGAMTGIISPSMAVWETRDEESDTASFSPLCDGPGDAFWLGVGSDEAIARQQLLADVVAPAFDAALSADGPLEVFPLLAEAVAMGDDCHMRHQAATMLLLRRTLGSMGAHAPGAVADVGRLLADNGHFALTVTIAACRVALERMRGTEGSSMVTFVSRNGVDAAIELAGLPGQWFSAPAEMVGDALYRPGVGDADAAPDIGDSALIECCGLGAAASAASPSVAAFLGGTLADAVERTRYMDDITLAQSETFRIPTLDGEGTPLGVDARAVLDLGQTPLINTGILHRVEGGQIGAGVAAAPLEPFRAALRALVERPSAS